MSVYVDHARIPLRLGSPHVGHWSHMWADTKEELEEMAEKIGLNPKWIQVSRSGIIHYDVVEWRRRRAIEEGAIPLDNRAATIHRQSLREKMRNEG